MPGANAYSGPLPENRSGFQFTTTVHPSNGSMRPGQLATWRGEAVAAGEVEIDGKMEETGYIPVTVTFISY
jgi:hypothetical protein